VHGSSLFSALREGLLGGKQPTLSFFYDGQEAEFKKKIHWAVSRRNAINGLNSVSDAVQSRVSAYLNYAKNNRSEFVVVMATSIATKKAFKLAAFSLLTPVVSAPAAFVIASAFAGGAGSALIRMGRNAYREFKADENKKQGYRKAVTDGLTRSLLHGFGLGGLAAFTIEVGNAAIPVASGCHFEPFNLTKIMRPHYIPGLHQGTELNDTTINTNDIYNATSNVTGGNGTIEQPFDTKPPCEISQPPETPVPPQPPETGAYWMKTNDPEVAEHRGWWGAKNTVPMRHVDPIYWRGVPEHHSHHVSIPSSEGSESGGMDGGGGESAPGGGSTENPAPTEPVPTPTDKPDCPAKPTDCNKPETPSEMKCKADCSVKMDCDHPKTTGHKDCPPRPKPFAYCPKPVCAVCT